MLAKIANDDADLLNARGAHPFFASKLAPTDEGLLRFYTFKGDVQLNFV